MPEIVIPAVTLLVGVLIGAVLRDFVRTVRRESAFTRRFGEDLDVFLARFRDNTAVRVGVIEDVPAVMVSPSWMRGMPEPVGQDGQSDGPMDDPYLWDDEDDYPRDEARVTHGAWRRETVRGDEEMAAWPVNETTGKHALRGDDTRDLTREAAAFRYEVEVAAP